MALLLPGTPCKLCGKPIAEGSDVVAFPAFLPPHHKFARFSDAVFHGDCFRHDPEAQQIEALYRRYREIWDSRPKGLRTRDEIDAWGREAFKDFWLELEAL